VRVLKFVVTFVLTVVIGAAAMAGAVALLGPSARTLADATTPLGDIDLTINSPAARSVVYDRYGNVMTTLFSEDRSPVKLKNVPQVLIDAVISIEDRRFYEHNGVDVGGTVRALVKNVDSGAVGQGGSTITQQLVKNTLSQNRERDLKTKAREAWLAMRLEDDMTKNEILESYLNLVYFGNGAYGVKAAAERYFPETPLKKLNLAQAALLAGVIQEPEGLNPIKHPDRAARRRVQVLDAMIANKKTTPAKAKKARLVPLPTKVSYPLEAQRDFYLDQVKTLMLQDDPTVQGDPGELLGSNQQTRAAAVFRGGLKVYTEYDPALQFVANAAMASKLPKSEFTAALVVIDNANGGVRAIANGLNFSQMQFDPATEAYRQGGSAFKTFTLAAALSRGYTPNDTVSGSPLTWRLGPGTGKDAYYNLSGDCYGGTPTLSKAIAASDNCAFTRLELSMGPGNYGGDGASTVISTAKAMGIDTSKYFQPVVSTTLGTNGVRPLDMAEAYSVFPNDGTLKPATFISKIVDASGKVLYQAPATGTRVLDVNVARTVTEMLEGPVRRGTAQRTLGNFPRPAAGKTGTTDGNVDAWFVGFTPQYTAAVWMGNPKGEVPMSNVGGQTVWGAGYPAQIWRAFMEAATDPLPVIDFIPPDEAQWGRPRYITEYGRRANSYVPSSGPRVNTPAPTVAPTTVAAPAPTTPPVTEPQTPETKPAKPTKPGQQKKKP
jgi:membrane peptidoglycan carboxypeptidase